jgi:hypothetical protein
MSDGAVIVVGPKEDADSNTVIKLGPYYPTLAEQTEELARVPMPDYPYNVYIWHKGGDAQEQAQAKAEELTDKGADR